VCSVVSVDSRFRVTHLQQLPQLIHVFPLVILILSVQILI
jgi:hypothetical protein